MPKWTARQQRSNKEGDVPYLANKSMSPNISKTESVGAVVVVMQQRSGHACHYRTSSRMSSLAQRGPSYGNLSAVVLLLLLMLSQLSAATPKIGYLH